MVALFFARKWIREKILKIDTKKYNLLQGSVCPVAVWIAGNALYKINNGIHGGLKIIHQKHQHLIKNIILKKNKFGTWQIVR